MRFPVVAAAVAALVLGAGARPSPSTRQGPVVVVRARGFLEQYDYSGPGPAAHVAVEEMGTGQRVQYDGPLRLQTRMRLPVPPTGAVGVALTIPMLGGPPIASTTRVNDVGDRTRLVFLVIESGALRPGA
jgi:hypothetical protein